MNEAFCPSCGQRTSVHKVTFRETFQDLADSMFSVSAPLWTTLKLLVINPGKLLREYLAGKRKRFYKPVTFFILTTIVYLLCRSLLDYNPLASASMPANDEVDVTIFFDAGQFMFANIDKILFFFVFALAISLKLFFYRKNSLAEFIAVSFYLLGIYTIITTIKIFVYTFVTQKYEALPMFLMLGYFLWAIISFFQKKKVLVFFKGIVTYVIAFLLYIVFGMGFSLIIVLLRS